MGMNIKNERVHQLAREAAARSGRSQTGAVEFALERLLADLDGVKGSSKRNAVERILTDVDRRLDGTERMALLADNLYDECGIPR